MKGSTGGSAWGGGAGPQDVNRCRRQRGVLGTRLDQEETANTESIRISEDHHRSVS